MGRTLTADWDGLMRIIERYYPAEVFGKVSSVDPGVRIISLVRALNQERALSEHYRKTLVRIADQQSGHWGVIAYESLRAAREGQVNEVQEVNGS